MVSIELTGAVFTQHIINTGRVTEQVLSNNSDVLQ